MEVPTSFLIKIFIEVQNSISTSEAAISITEISICVIEIPTSFHIKVVILINVSISTNATSISNTENSIFHIGIFTSTVVLL